jgi:vitamin B12 transporter
MIRISLSTLVSVLISSGGAVAQTTVAPADQQADIVVTRRGLADAPRDRA